MVYERSELENIERTYAEKMLLETERYKRTMRDIKDQRDMAIAKVRSRLARGVMVCPVCKGTGDTPGIMVGSVEEMRCKTCEGKGEVPA